MAREFEYRANGDANRVKSGNRKTALVKLSMCFLLLVFGVARVAIDATREILNFETIVGWQESIKNYPAVFLWVLGIYVMSSLSSVSDNAAECRNGSDFWSDRRKSVCLCWLAM
jgi:uncharacterized metal-binding protein